MAFLFPDDVQAINDVLQQRTGFHPELVQACQEHIELGQYDVAVFKAFRVLEGRIQHRCGIQGQGVSDTLNLAQRQHVLGGKLGLTDKQEANLSNLLKAAFAVFRNPEAHPGEAIVEYGSAECQAVLAFVNLMLNVLDREPPPPLLVALEQIRRDIGPDATTRLERFLDRILALDLKMPKSARDFSFRAWALRPGWEDTPLKRRRTTVFYLRVKPGNPSLEFPARSQWHTIVGFDGDVHVGRLRDLGAIEVATPSGGRLELALREHNSFETFERLYAIVRDVVAEMERSLTAQ